MRIDLNADLGEGFGAWKLGDDDALLEIVTSANVACGFHAGDPVTIRRVCEAAVARGVAIGAQVSYRDLAGFGRREMDVPAEELRAEILYQLAAVDGIARACGGRVTYVKPHGALYNRVIWDPVQARAVVEAVADHGGLPILTLPGSVVHGMGLPTVAECFADRAYTPRGPWCPGASPARSCTTPARWPPARCGWPATASWWRSTAPRCGWRPGPSACTATPPVRYASRGPSAMRSPARVWQWRRSRDQAGGRAGPAGRDGVTGGLPPARRPAAAADRRRGDRPGPETVLVVGGRADRLIPLIEQLDHSPLHDLDGEPVEIPVVYDGADLPDVAALAGISVDEVIARHTGSEFVAGWLGFAPGFAYLVGLDPDAARAPARPAPDRRARRGGGRRRGLFGGLPGGLARRVAADRPHLALGVGRDQRLPRAAQAGDQGQDGRHVTVEIIAPGPYATVQDSRAAGLRASGRPRGRGRPTCRACGWPTGWSGTPRTPPPSS